MAPVPAAAAPVATRDAGLRILWVVLLGVVLGLVLGGWIGARTEASVAASSRLRVATAAGSTTATNDAPASFTVADVAAGRVDRATFDAFWSEEVARIEALPCPQTAPAGSTTVRLSVGATPTATQLAAGWTDWAPRIAAAHDDHARTCAAG